MFAHLGLKFSQYNLVFKNGMVYLDSPVTSDIVKRDRLSNAEAHKEDVCLYFYCQYEGHYSLKIKSGTLNFEISFSPLSRKEDAQSQSWCCRKCPILKICKSSFFFAFSELDCTCIEYPQMWVKLNCAGELVKPSWGVACWHLVTDEPGISH